MIIGIEGLANAGKTFYCTKLLKREWKKGSRIHSNYKLLFSESNENIFRWKALSELYNLKNGIITVDEASIVLDNQNWMRLPQGFKDLIAKHRHHKVDIYTTMQNYLDIDVKVRKNIHELYTTECIFRIPKNQRVKPIIQISTIMKKRRVYGESHSIRWANAWAFKRLMIISRLWTKAYYDTYADMDLDKYLCQMKIQKGKPLLKMYSREIVDRGKRRI